MRRLAFALAMGAVAFGLPAAAQVWNHNTHWPGMNHGILASSSPANGAVLDDARRALSLTCIHAVRLQTLTITDMNGVPVPLTWTRPSHPVATYSIALPALADGLYQVEFTATGTGGTDIMSGGIRFTIR
jgi:methionine-rich copper-binding protein CopC